LMLTIKGTVVDQKNGAPSDQSSLRALPSVDALLKYPGAKDFVLTHGRKLTVYALRAVLESVRARLQKGEKVPSIEELYIETRACMQKISGVSLKPVINATGIVLHTNLGRAVLGKAVLADIAPIIADYSTVEFDCASASRGNRHEHIRELLRYCTKAEDILVVNNNAAGIILALNTLANGREVIVSRGELIEIGGEFRIPDIMAASGAIMVEAGTTNRTRVEDYEKAITERTTLIFKAHKSNYAMSGFVEEASVRQLAALARKRGLPLVYDIGSGLLRKPAGLPLENEPDVASAIADGADIVLFSGDKLLGGPQAGILAGKKDPIRQCARAPLMRALRVGKLTLAALASACRNYLDDARLLENNPTFAMLSKTSESILKSAQSLRDALVARSLSASVIPTIGQCGGGTLPDVQLLGHGVRLDIAGMTNSEKAKISEKIFKGLLLIDRPILGILREGELLFDMRTIEDDNIEYIAGAVEEVVRRITAAPPQFPGGGLF
jgi:L-seryl-tRNA(Ser) seleniumtransferase